MTSSPENEIIEHVVLFKVKEDEEEENEEENSIKVNDMVNELNALNSAIDSVLYLTAGPILRTRSKSSSPLSFTHMLHARYRTVSDLQDYSLHPAHVSVVDNLVRPLCDDVMAVDWSSSLGENNSVLVPRPGSAMRVTFLQVEGEKEKQDFFERIQKIKEGMEPYEQISFGENFSERGKGFSVAALVVFPNINELDSAEEYEDQMRSLVHKFKGSDDGIVSVDYVVPRLTNLNSTTE